MFRFKYFLFCFPLESGIILISAINFIAAVASAALLTVLLVAVQLADCNTFTAEQHYTEWICSDDIEGKISSHLIA